VLHLEYRQLGFRKSSLGLQNLPLAVNRRMIGRMPSAGNSSVDLLGGRVHLDLPPLHDCTIQQADGPRRLLSAAQGDKPEPFGALIVEDDLDIEDGPNPDEESGQVRVPEREGNVGDVKPAGNSFFGLPNAGIPPFRETFRHGDGWNL